MAFNTTIVWVNVVIFAAGLIVLAKGSDWFIEGAAFVAHHFKVPDVVIGLTLVSIGTSLPELATNVCAAIQNEGAVALGNVTGSNISNVLLVLGLAVVFAGRVPIARILFNRDMMVMSGTFLVFGLMCYLFPAAEPVVSRIEGAVLLTFFVVYMVFLFKHKDEMKTEVEPEAEETKKKAKNLGTAYVFVLLGGVMITFGAKMMVDNVVWAAENLLKNVPNAKVIISATVVAFGTSVPELAVTLAGIIKGKINIALGNIIGSNIFNLVFVMGVTALIRPVVVSDEVAIFILPYMLLTGVALVIFMRTAWALVRWEGVVLLVGYAAFIGINVWKCLPPAP